MIKTPETFQYPVEIFSPSELPVLPKGALMAITQYCEDDADRPATVSGNRELRQCEHGYARLLIQQLIDKLYPDVLKPFDYCKDEGGKPFGRIGKRVVPLSVSHSKTHVFVIVSPEANIGLDVESEGRTYPRDLRNRILSDDESVDYRMKDVDTLRLWSAKESVLKLEGTGLRQSMRSVGLKYEPPHRFYGHIGNRSFIVQSVLFREHWLSVSEYLP